MDLEILLDELVLMAVLILNRFGSTAVFAPITIDFFIAYEKVAQAVRQIESLPIFNIPWGHNIILLQKIKDVDERL